MIEVEIKVRINDIDVFKKGLDKIGAKLIKKEKQIDKIFGHPMFLDSNRMVIEGGIVPRIRVTNNKKILEFKEISRQSGGIEIKSELSDVNIGLRFLEKLGFKETFTISKSRDVYSYNDFEICIDNVKQLGNFIEIEKMVPSPEDKEKARKDCLDLLHTLAPNSELVNKKYGDLMQEIINRKSSNLL